MGDSICSTVDKDEDPPSILDKIHQASSFVNELETLRTKLEARKDEAQKVIRSKMNDLHLLIDKWEARFLDTMNETLDEKIENVSKQEETLRNTLQCIQEHVNFTNSSQDFLFNSNSHSLEPYGDDLVNEIPSSEEVSHLDEDEEIEHVEDEIVKQYWKTWNGLTFPLKPVGVSVEEITADLWSEFGQLLEESRKSLKRSLLFVGGIIRAYMRRGHKKDEWVAMVRRLEARVENHTHETDLSTDPGFLPKPIDSYISPGKTLYFTIWFAISNVFKYRNELRYKNPLVKYIDYLYSHFPSHVNFYLLQIVNLMLCYKDFPLTLYILSKCKVESHLAVQVYFLISSMSQVGSPKWQKRCLKLIKLIVHELPVSQLSSDRTRDHHRIVERGHLMPPTPNHICDQSRSVHNPSKHILTSSCLTTTDNDKAQRKGSIPNIAMRSQTMLQQSMSTNPNPLTTNQQSEHECAITKMRLKRSSTISSLGGSSVPRQDSIFDTNIPALFRMRPYITQSLPLRSSSLNFLQPQLPFNVFSGNNPGNKPTCYPNLATNDYFLDEKTHLDTMINCAKFQHEIDQIANADSINLTSANNAPNNVANHTVNNTNDQSITIGHNNSHHNDLSSQWMVSPKYPFPDDEQSNLNVPFSQNMASTSIEKPRHDESSQLANNIPNHTLPFISESKSHISTSNLQPQLSSLDHLDKPQFNPEENLPTLFSNQFPDHKLQRDENIDHANTHSMDAKPFNIPTSSTTFVDQSNPTMNTMMSQDTPLSELSPCPISSTNIAASVPTDHDAINKNDNLKLHLQQPLKSVTSLQSTQEDAVDEIMRIIEKNIVPQAQLIDSHLEETVGKEYFFSQVKFAFKLVDVSRKLGELYGHPHLYHCMLKDELLKLEPLLYSGYAYLPNLNAQTRVLRFNIDYCHPIPTYGRVLYKLVIEVVSLPNYYTHEMVDEYLLLNPDFAKVAAINRGSGILDCTNSSTSDVMVSPSDTTSTLSQSMNDLVGKSMNHSLSESNELPPLNAQMDSDIHKSATASFPTHNNHPLSFDHSHSPSTFDSLNHPNLDLHYPYMHPLSQCKHASDHPKSSSTSSDGLDNPSQPIHATFDATGRQPMPSLPQDSCKHCASYIRSKSPTPSQPLSNDSPTISAFELETFGTSWREIRRNIKQSSPYSVLPHWDVHCYIVKHGDFVLQEQFVMQLLSQFQKIWEMENLPLKLSCYNIIALSYQSGLIQVVPNAISLDRLKKYSEKNGATLSLLDVFQKRWPASDDFKRARCNFVASLAAYSIVCYLLQIKDRHNGNIMLDSDGHIFHIDFGYLLSRTIKFEKAPFKLTDEFVELMGGDQSKSFKAYCSLCVFAFLAARKHYRKILLVIEMSMGQGGSIPCLEPKQIIPHLKKRYHLDWTETQCEEHIMNLINEARDNWRTQLYDTYQRLVNDIH